MCIRDRADVGSQATRERDRLDSGASLTHHLDVRLGIEDHHKPDPDEVVVVRDEHAYGSLVSAAH